MRTVKAITGISAAERFYKRLGGAIRYMLPAATALAFLGLTTDVKAQTPSTDINFTNLSINENEAIGTAVGFLSTVDVDGGSYTYSLVPGVGDDDNASFDILANKLQSNEIFNYEVRGSYSVRVATTGLDGLTFEEAVTITIDDVNDKPVLDSYMAMVLHGNTLALALTDFEFAFSDEDGHGLNEIQITSLPSDGLLRLGAVPVNVGDFISAGDLDNLRFDAPTPMAGIVSFTFSANDGSETSAADGTYFIKINQDRGSSVITDPDASVTTLVPGTVIVGHPGTHLTFADPDAYGGTGGSSIGRRPVASNPDPSLNKIGEETAVGTVENFDLNVNAYPNPFASDAVLRFTLPEDAMVEVNIYNYVGALVKQVINGMQPSGVNTVNIGGDLSNGSYIYTIKVMGAEGQTDLYRTGSIVKIK